MSEIFKFTPKEIKRVDSYQASHRVSILTILFSDIVGYTQLCERTSESVLTKLRSAFDHITATTVEERNNGLIVKRIGDAILAIYAQPTSAVLSAIELHSFLAENPIEGISLELRTGIHVGQVAVTETGTHVDIFGRHVNRTARVQAVALPGEILVTEPVEDNVRGWLETSSDQNITFRRRKTHILKGVSDPVTVYTVEHNRTAASPPDDRLPDSYVELHVVRGSDVGTKLRFDLDHGRSIIIGRSENAEVMLTERLASRKHAMIAVNNNAAWEVSDLGSAHGTFVNGKPIERSRIKIGDRIRIGDAVIVVEALRLRNKPLLLRRHAGRSKKYRDRVRLEDRLPTKPAGLRARGARGSKLATRKTRSKSRA